MPPESPEQAWAPPDAALLRLLARLQADGYRFVTVTPSTHARVVKRGDRAEARSLRDVLGWSLPFAADLPPPDLLALMREAGVVERRGARLAANVRVSSLHGRLFLHSAFPTDRPDSVFLGPDSYRFADFIAAEAEAGSPVRRLAEIGAGAGVGAVVAAGPSPGAEVLLTDINPEALRLARLNAAAAGLDVQAVRTSGLDGVEGPFDLIVANPPYIADPEGLTYRDGGGLHGGQMAVDWARAAAGRLAPGGRLLLYTGAAIVDGRDDVRAALQETAADAGCALRYREIDPDVFGEQLDLPGYEDVERIAAVGAVLSRAP